MKTTTEVDSKRSGEIFAGLLIAASGEKAGLALVVDRGFDLFAEVTGKSVETLALR